MANKDSFSDRIVRYEYLHNIKDVFFDELNKACSLIKGSKILDVGCGYGSVTRELLKRNSGLHLKFYLSDANSIQLSRAKKELEKIDFDYDGSINYQVDNIVDTLLEDNCFDRVIAKMVIHEVPKEFQQEAIDNLFKILKKGGRLVIWDMALDSETQFFVQDIIREKDRLAGYSSLVRNRYFLRFEEIKSMLEKAGFSRIRKEYDIISKVSTSRRLEQEFNNDISLLRQWEDYIKEKSLNENPVVLKKLKVIATEDEISFIPQKAIISAIK